MSERGGAAGHFHAVILAGGRGTRFWPRSRRDLPKQLLPAEGDASLLQQTASRLESLIPPERMWVVTSERLRRQVARQLPRVPRRQIIAEPVQRNTAPAIALAARLLLERDPGAVMGVFPSDHVIGKPARFLKLLRRAARAAQAGNLIVLGIPPTRPESGYGYIRFPAGAQAGSTKPLPVLGFAEKPARAKARRWLRAGNYYWNSGMFVWSARTIAEAVERLLPATAAALAKLAPGASRRFGATLRAHYHECDNISIDYGVLERAKNIAGFACPELGWSDLGTWDSVYDLLPKDGRGNAGQGGGEDVLFAEGASGNFVQARGKLVVLAGVKDLIVVDTPDALLVCRRDHAQKVSGIVKMLEDAGREDVL
jgi:mannose-1-phosphate guanylyltransferase